MSVEELFDVDADPFSTATPSVGPRPSGLEEVDEDEVSPTYFGSADEWVRKFLLPS